MRMCSDAMPWRVKKPFFSATTVGKNPGELDEMPMRTLSSARAPAKIASTSASAVLVVKTFFIYAPLLRHVDRDAVRVGRLERAAVAFGQELQANLALGAGGLARQRGQIFFERFEVLDLEADMIHVARLDAGAVVVADIPRHDDERHAPVGEIVIRIAGGLLRLLQLV